MAPFQITGIRRNFFPPDGQNHKIYRTVANPSPFFAPFQASRPAAGQPQASSSRRPAAAGQQQASRPAGQQQASRPAAGQQASSRPAAGQQQAGSRSAAGQQETSHTCLGNEETTLVAPLRPEKKSSDLGAQNLTEPSPPRILAKGALKAERRSTPQSVAGGETEYSAVPPELYIILRLQRGKRSNSPPVYR